MVHDQKGGTMSNKMEFLSVMNIDGYVVEAVTSPENLNVTLWITKRNSDLKMKMGQFRTNLVGDKTMTMITDIVNKNLEMKIFDFECLLKSAVSEGLIERNPDA
jgi:hypothetical protein